MIIETTVLKAGLLRLMTWCRGPDNLQDQWEDIRHKIEAQAHVDWETAGMTMQEMGGVRVPVGADMDRPVKLNLESADFRGLQLALDAVIWPGMPDAWGSRRREIKDDLGRWFEEAQAKEQFERLPKKMRARLRKTLAEEDAEEEAEEEAEENGEPESEES